MVEKGFTTGCEGCPGNEGRRLSQLASQYIPLEDWLFKPSDNMPGQYSLEAINTLNEYYYLQPPRYKVPKPNTLAVLQDGVILMDRVAETSNDTTLTPNDIRLLETRAVERNRTYKKFRQQDTSRSLKIAEAARPFLDGLALDLYTFDPDLRSSIAPLDELLKRREADPTLSLARDLVSSTTALTTAHFLDQGTFGIASQTLEQCPGPWVLPKKGILFTSPSLRVFCAQSEHTRDYFRAKVFTQTARRGR